MPKITPVGKLTAPPDKRGLSSKKWNAIVIGAGHNGLVCASYLAMAGKRVLVLEAREKVGGACTLEEPWPGIFMSPCAYILGLFPMRLVRELQLKELGLEWYPAWGGMFLPFEDGTSLQLWHDDKKCAEEVARFAPQDLDGWRAMGEVKRRLRDALRPEGDKDVWLSKPLSRAQLEERLKDDEHARKLLFEWSMAEFVEHYLSDEKMQMAYLGQGVIGTKASPFARGTASVHFHHASGRYEGQAGTWGYVKGGMGRLSFLLAERALALGVTIATEAEVVELSPGKGLRLASGEKLESPQIISNADPRVLKRILGKSADPQWSRRVDSIPQEGCTVKVNAALSELPNFLARPGTKQNDVHFAEINTPLTKQQWKDAFAAALKGELPKQLWTELYFQTPFDASVAPPGVHTMSVFAQYVPYHLAQGTWDSRRQDVEKLVWDSIGRFCSNVPRNVLHAEVMGPPDIEKKVGLTGGHIFQGEILPEYMWDQRLGYETPMEGVYLCGAATYPGGSVMGVNGRNAALTILGQFG